MQKHRTPGDRVPQWMIDANIFVMKPISEKQNLSVLQGDRPDREQELVELLFTGTHDDIKRKMDQLTPKGKLSLASCADHKPPVGR